MPENDGIDRQVLNELLVSIGDDREFLNELIQTFFEDGPNQIADILSGLQNNDHELVRRAAHSLKSNSATFGAITLQELSKKMEDAGKRGDLSGQEQLLVKIRAEFTRVDKTLIRIQKND